ncbi:hypothetical protein Nocox_03755 [Nonomuraea coxensis DSM 45129]|uniref:DUF2637 domain-containing protein n=1 Tax=Nonomuraea coxensis DSM 45129 TaxID=1122611 RepID=A0ABX8TSD7_9ACTN|nr:DUF2637 domain-containing protein [Nonomuraea coxensis]QYC38380.1 hypothetical protein Nocox_03755 [Nonomuraea coxensis DSM 45129]
MDVTPPSLLRRLGIALAGLAVAALAGAACALSFDDLRALAVVGEARTDLAFLYPAAFDALLVVALVCVLLLRSARALVRVQAATVMVLLITAAAAVNVATATRFAFDARQVAVGVALAPWVMLAVALWLWLLLIKHVQSGGRMAGGRVAGSEDDGAAETDIVPFRRGRGAAEAGPPPLVATGTAGSVTSTAAAAAVLEPTPVVGPTPAPETPPVSPYEAAASTREDGEAGIPTQEIPVPGRRPGEGRHDVVRAEPAQAPDGPSGAGQDEHGSLDVPVSAQVAEWHAAQDPPQAQRPDQPDRSPESSEQSDVSNESGDSGESQQAEGPREGRERAPGRRSAELQEPAKAQEPTPQEPESQEQERRELERRELQAQEPESGPGLADAVTAEQAQEPTQPHHREAAHHSRVTADEDAPGRAEEPAAPRPQEPPTRPVRWGDRYKPTDVLVHPRPDPRNADTQPQPIIRDEPPRSKAQPKSQSPSDAPEGELEDTAPHPVIHEDTPAPSGRLRSTPRPPEPEPED